MNLFKKTFDYLRGRRKVGERIGWKPTWVIRKWATDEDYAAGAEPYETRRVEGNLLLNEGITALLNLLIGAAEAAFSNANAYLGVGDSATAASASQTGLQASTNKLYKAMETSYPSITGQAVTFRSVFGDSEANWAWNEFSVSNASGGDSGDNLNRVVSSEGTKASGTWTLDLEITMS